MMNLVNQKTRVVGVDISSDFTTYALVDVRGNILAKDEFPTAECPTVASFVNRLCESIVKLVEANGGYETVRSVGVSSPSASFVTGSIEHAANLPWKGIVPLAAMMRDQLGLAVGVANDAHATALGESVYGSAHGMKNYIVIHLGTGLGSCFFSEGREHLGKNGYAGEFGHICMVPEGGRQCGCGHTGCLETYVNNKGIIQTAREMMAASDEPSLMRSLDDLSPRTIVECCEQGDKMAQEVFRYTGKILGWGLANYACIVSPEAIVLTGGIFKAGKWLLEPTQEAFEKHIFHNMQGRVKLLLSTLETSDREVLGASALAWDVEEYSLFK